LFATTIANNIKYGLHTSKIEDFSTLGQNIQQRIDENHNKHTQQQIEEAAKLANAHHFIMKVSRKQ
jgi:ABC-type multidrug transport system fused ATPase/permease subunit